MTDEQAAPDEAVAHESTESARLGMTEAVRRSMELLDPRDRVKYWLAVGIQMGLSFLDLIGVLLVGLVAALAVASISPGAALPSFAQSVVDAVGLSDVPLLSLALWAAAAAAAFLIVKSLLAVVLIRRILRFLAGRQAQVASRLTSELFGRPLTYIQLRTSQQTAYALMEGTTFATVILLGSLSLFLSDMALLVLLTGTLMVIDPVVTVAAIGFFLLIALILQRVLGSMARRAGVTGRDMAIAARSSVQEGLAAYREITVGNRRSLYRDRITDSVWSAAGAQADVQFIAQVPKFVFETALVVGALALVAAQSGLSDPADAVGTMALFLAAGARVMPSLLRLQVSLINIRAAEAQARPAYDLDMELRGDRSSNVDFDVDAFEESVASGHEGFEATVTIDHVTYTYPGADAPAAADVSLKAHPGMSVAMVGSTGAGKSTLADLILGVLPPDRGEILVGGVSPAEASHRWPGAVSYVPQAVALVAGSVRENVALGIPIPVVDDARVWEALERARLADFLREGREGLDTTIGERGVRLSGGQRQRLGIARALYSRPSLLVLDEATSALDAETEASITAMLADLAGRVTTITVAHRLATVRSADLLLYMEDGHVVASGTFDEVRAQQPSFDHQAKLLGL